MIKLALYADSLGCPRKGIVNSDQRYIALIENHLRTKYNQEYIEIRDKSKGGVTLPELLEQYNVDNGYYQLPGDYFILHAGIVDCAPRPIGDYLKQKISVLPGILKNRIIKYIHHNRARFINRTNGRLVRTSPTDFEKTLSNLLNHTSSNYTKTFVINVCPTNQLIETRSPGLTKNIIKYNKIIEDAIISLRSENVILIDVYNELSSSKDLDLYIVKEDGHHIYPLTHELIANKIISHF